MSDFLTVYLNANDKNFQAAMERARTTAAKSQERFSKLGTAVSGLGFAMGSATGKAGQFVTEGANLVGLFGALGPMGVAGGAAILGISLVAKELGKMREEAEKAEKAVNDLYDYVARETESAERRLRVARLGREKADKVERGKKIEELRDEYDKQSEMADGLADRIAGINALGPEAKARSAAALASLREEMNEALAAAEKAGEAIADLERVGRIHEMAGALEGAGKKGGKKKGGKKDPDPMVDDPLYFLRAEYELIGVLRDAQEWADQQHADAIREHMNLLADMHADRMRDLGEYTDAIRSNMDDVADMQKEWAAADRAIAEGVAAEAIAGTQLLSQIGTDYAVLQIQMRRAREAGNADLLATLKEQESEYWAASLAMVMQHLSQVAIGKGAILAIEGAGLIFTNPAAAASQIGAGGALIALGLGGMAGAAAVGTAFTGGSSYAPAPDNDRPSSTRPAEISGPGREAESREPVVNNWIIGGSLYMGRDQTARDFVDLFERGMELRGRRPR